MRADVVVVGGGPAGSAAAITLARAGRAVLLVDKAIFPRDKCCGDGITTGALRLLEHLGLDPELVREWTDCGTARVRTPAGRVITFPFPEGRGRYASVAPRLELDAALVDVARAAGAKVFEGHALTGADASPSDRVVLQLEHGDVEARYVVGADGMWSPLRKALGLAEPGYLGESHAFRQYFSGVTGPAAHELWVWFEPDLLPGYAWSFPLRGGRANVGFGVVRDGRRHIRDMKQQWYDLLERPHVREALGPCAAPESTHKAWPIPAGIDAAPLASGRVLFAGDAARATDPLTGEGIGQALLTGMLAADAILGAGALHPQRAAHRYDRAVRAELSADQRMARCVQALLKQPRSAELALGLAGATAWTRSNVARWLFEDEPRGIVLTPSRWHRGFLARDGAYRTPRSS